MKKLTVQGNIKQFRSEDYNYNFNMETGFFQRWGKTITEDPVCSPYCEIADIEITTSCRGPIINGKNQLCSFCYKANTPNGKYMSFDTFKTIFDKFPHTTDIEGKRIFFLTQVAFGVDAECATNPDVWKIFVYCRENGVIPNLTVATISNNTALNIAGLCGACAVSRYSDKDGCYNSIDLLTNKYNMSQVNIHQLVAKSTLSNIWETLQDIKSDPRLSKLNAIVFLSLKKKGRGINHEPIDADEYKEIVQYCLKHNISFGSDSCGAGKLLKSLTPDQYSQILPVVEPCEAASMSFYCDVNGMYFPCSFMPGVGDWDTGIDMLSITDFVKDVWENPKTLAFRERVAKCNKCLEGCCHFKI